MLRFNTSMATGHGDKSSLKRHADAATLVRRVRDVQHSAATRQEMSCIFKLMKSNVIGAQHRSIRLSKKINEKKRNYIFTNKRIYRVCVCKKMFQIYLYIR